MAYKIISGIIFKEDIPEIITGSIYIDEQNKICEIEEKNVKEKQWIVPRFINAHIHVGDSILKDPPLGKKKKYSFVPNLDYIVKPPNGLKHKILDTSKNKNIIKSINITFKELYKNGTITIVDFREGGKKGINLLSNIKKKYKDIIKTFILSRPKLKNKNITNIYLKQLVDKSDGFGISGYNDLDENLLFNLREISLKSKKLFFIHSGEKNRYDITKTINLNPNALIHMTHASQQDLRSVYDKNISVITCPRSNMITGVGFPPINKMLQNKICVGIGTDNIMLNSPNMFEEMNILSKYYKLNENTIYSILFKNNYQILKSYNQKIDPIIKVGNEANIFIINSKSYNLSGVFDPLAGFIRRARIDDIIKIL